MKECSYKKFTKEKRWQKYILVKTKYGKKAKILKEKKVAPPGIEPGSLDPKSDALPLSYRGRKLSGFKSMDLNYLTKIVFELASTLTFK